MHALRVAALTLLLWATVVGTTVVSQEPRPLAAGLLVGYDYLHSDFERALAGTLHLDGDYVRYRSTNGALNWDLDIKDIVRVTWMQIDGPARRVQAVEVVSFEDGRTIHRRLASLFDDLTYREPLLLFGVLQVKVERARAARLNASRPE
jgi:hypothetical protein